jgi:cysteine-rich repeat protein
MRIKISLVLSFIAALWGCDLAGEKCDDGIDNDDNGLTDCADPSCQAEPRCAACGDGEINASFGEDCDDKNLQDGDTCDSDCSFPCGDGSRNDEDEACDDGNQASGDGCEPDCSLTFPGCGDGDLDPGEPCDDANANNNDACTDICVEARCGDGFVHFGVEQCDDGNMVSGDGCVADCSRDEVCGDGILDPGEACDTRGELTPTCGDKCSLLMLTCNNGVRDEGEVCFIETPQQILVDPDGLDVWKLALGDLDGDLDLDLAATTRTPESVVVLLNDGKGRFTLHASLFVGPAPSTLVAADLDGDKDVDLAVALGGADPTHQVAVLKNDGQAQLTSAGAFNTGGDDAMGMDAGDLDGDGDIDLVVGNAGSDNLSVFMNNGQGSFGAPTLLSTASSVSDVILGSADADADLDIFAVLSFKDSVSLYLNNGSGTFGAPTLMPSGGSSPEVGDLGDIDGDSDLDLVTVNSVSHDAGVLQNNGSGTYAVSASIPLSDFAIPEDVVLADFDGNNTLDMVAAMNGIHVLFNNGSGSFTAPLTFYDFFYRGALAAGDFNGDGANDLAVAGGYIGGGEISIYLARP